MTFQRRVRQLHKILTLVVFVQLFLWMLSGLYMTAVPIEIVRGNHLVDHATPNSLPVTDVLPIEKVTAAFTSIESVRLYTVLNTPAYEVVSNDVTYKLNALTGMPLQPIEESQVRALAASAYQDSASISAIELLTHHAPAEVGSRPLPLYKVDFDDWLHTRFYVSALDARIVAVRTDIWRLFDVFWMLHIMDYDEREDFNNPLVILMSSLGLLAIVSGVLLIANGLRRGGVKAMVK